MPRRARMATCAAAAGVLLLVALWYGKAHLGLIRHADRSVLLGFIGLGRPRLDRLTTFVASLCDPKPYVFLAAIPVIVALLRRRPRVAVAVGLCMLGANASAELLKPLLALPPSEQPMGPPWVGGPSFPSGHATAAMSLLLAGVIVAPGRWRGRVAATLAAFAVAVCYSFLELGWHYPTDVVGGFLLATAWMLAGAAAVDVIDARRPRRTSPRSDGSGRSRPPLREALWPMVALLAGGLAAAGLVMLVRPQEVLAYAAHHTAFVVGAAGIGALGLTLASAMVLVLRVPAQDR